MSNHIFSKDCSCVECFKVKALIDITHQIDQSSKELKQIAFQLSGIYSKLK